ncbi:hypothetical protein FGG08_000396 [Glutinoglossum americanum]|uniref:CCHC-type domain-containing protein n=1 Tax=Glutinoglossum americanum TaxID=1670608 RepID=A0A9P8L621_9PEZI|nr:hypothetical protein FGG08_000396 [Glutinoglossum americanum]
MYSNPYVGGQPQDYQQQHSRGYGQPFVQNPQLQQQQYGVHYPTSINPQQPASVLGQQQAQSCFNCGSVEHWAQHCPEPRRAIPVSVHPYISRVNLAANNSCSGTVNKQVPPVNTQIPVMPLTVQKTGGPTITRYPPPPGYQQQYGQRAPPSGPPTPMSAYSQPYGQQWPQGPQNQYSPMSSQGSPHPHHAPYGYPTPVTPYGSQYPSPASAQSQPYQNGFFPQQGQYQQQYGPQQATNPQCYPNQIQSLQNPNPTHRSLTMPQQSQQPYSFYGSIQSCPPSAPHIAQGNGTYGPPDYPAWTPSQGDAQTIEPAHGEITRLAPMPAGRPLATTFLQSEAQEPLPPPWSEESGNSVSKFFSLKSFSEACVTIRDTEGWRYMKDDPIFRQITDGGDLIPIEELLACRGRNIQYEDSKDQSRATPVPSDHGDNQSDQPGWSVMDNLENALNSGDFTTVSSKPKQVKSEPFDIAEMEQLDRAEEFTQRKLTLDMVPKQEKTVISSSESQEEKLARLGVTGTPKPVTSRIPSQSVDRGNPRRRSRSPAYDRRQSFDSCSSNTRTDRHQNYRERDALQPHVERLDIKRQNSHGNSNSIAGSSRTNDQHSPQQQYGLAHTYGIHAAPPPPPPPPTHCYYGGTDNRSPPGHENFRRTSRGSSEALNDNQLSSSSRRSASPSGSRSKNPIGSGKEYRERDRLSGGRDEPQRQPDDLATKRKRSQPQVADAYR